jgi:hypothetical protein
LTLTWDPTKCRARAGRPEGIRSPHASDDDLEPAVTFLKKNKFFLEDTRDFSDRVVRCYYARELSQHAIDSLHTDISVLSYLQRLSAACTDDPEALQEPRGLIQLHARLVLEFGLPSGTQLESEETQDTLTGDQRMCVSRLTAEDEALPLGLFRPVEADALRVLVARREADGDMFGEDEQACAVEDDIDQQRTVTACAAARLAGTDREEERDAIYELDISEGELEVSLLSIHSELRTEFGLDPLDPSSDGSPWS